jgi:O-antigen ligase
MTASLHVESPAADPRDVGGSAPEARTDRFLASIVVLNVIALPILVPRGPGNTVPADLTAIALVVFGVAGLWHARIPVRLPLGMSYLLLLVGGLLGAAQSIAPRDALLATTIDVYLYVWFVVLVNVILMQGRRLVDIAAMAWACTGLVVGCIGTIAAVLGHERVPTLLGYDFVDRWERYSGSFRDPNMAGNYLVITLFVIAASPWPRGWLPKALICVPIAVSIHATGSNTALFALAAGVAITAVVALVRSRRSAIAATGVVVAVVLTVFALAPNAVVEGPADVARALGERPAFQGSLSRFDSSLGPRIERLQRAFESFGPQVLLGIGPSTTKAALEAMDAPIGGELHNDYVAAALERGLVGLIGLFMFFGVALWTAIRLVARNGAPGWHASFLLGGVVAVTVTALGLETLHFRHVWFLFAIVFALAALVSRDRLHDPSLR